MNRSFCRVFSCVLVLGAFGISSTAQAGWNLGILAGQNVPLAEGADAGTSGGVVVGYGITPEIEAGIYAHVVSTSVINEEAGYEIEGSTTWIGVEGTYKVFEGLGLGLKLGTYNQSVTLTFTELDIEGTAESESALSWGPKVSYDYAFAEHWSVGGVVDYLMNSAIGDGEASTQIDAFLSVKYLF